MKNEETIVSAARSFDQMYRANRKLLWVMCILSGLGFFSIVGAVLIITRNHERTSDAILMNRAVSQAIIDGRCFPLK